jgi:hypothetical protein
MRAARESGPIFFSVAGPLRNTKCQQGLSELGTVAIAASDGSRDLFGRTRDFRRVRYREHKARFGVFLSSWPEQEAALCVLPSRLPNTGFKIILPRAEDS